jgi:predicted nucleic acid-binding protein
MWSGGCVAAIDPLARIISDAGPLIHLDELDSLDLLADFPLILVPNTVWEEVQRHRPQALSGVHCRLEHEAVRRLADPELEVLFSAFALDAGEKGALASLRSHPGSILLTDDAAARLAAKTLGFQVHGSIGILLRAIRRGQRSRSEVLALLRELPRRSTLHIRPGLLQEIIEEVEGSKV